MAIRAALEQPCMAFCGHQIFPGMYIEEGPNGWQHWRCPEGKPRGRGTGARSVGRMMRQGDVLLVEAPRSAPSVYQRDVHRDDAGRLVLAVGEATGHLHAVGEPTARLVDDRDARYLLVGGSGATLVHDEHAPVEIPMGRWRVVRQREWDGFVGFREVRD